jgi:hypothetical protein
MISCVKSPYILVGTYRATRHHIPEDHNTDINLKTCIARYVMRFIMVC